MVLCFYSHSNSIKTSEQSRIPRKLGVLQKHLSRFVRIFSGGGMVTEGDKTECNTLIHVVNIDETVDPDTLNRLAKSWARFLSLARSKLRLCSANHRPGY